MTRILRIAVVVALQDAGEATRSVEIAHGLHRYRPPDRDVEITFLSHGARFDPLIHEAGFGIHRCLPEFEGRSVADDLQWDPPEIYGSVALAREVLEGERTALAALHPDAVLHGFWPTANIAATSLGIPTMCFSPLPMDLQAFTSLMTDLPDQAPAALSGLPRPARRLLIQATPVTVKRRLGVLRQHRLRQAATECGWVDPVPEDLFATLRSGVAIINDLPQFYRDCPLPPHMSVTGPLFAPSSDTTIDPGVMASLSPDDPNPKILCTMGSSGRKPAFLEAIRAVAAGPPPPAPTGARTATAWNAVVLASSAVCPLTEARATAGDHPGIYITDAFVPAAAINPLADVVVSHGGQGTVQTALASATPIVGVAMQPEQQINLDLAVSYGAAIRIRARDWRAPVIRQAIATVLREPSYRARAQDLATHIHTLDGQRTAAERLWKYLTTLEQHTWPTADQ